MDIMQVIRARHSVRAYTGREIESEKRQELDRLIEQYTAESGLHLQMRYDDPSGFDSRLAHYGRFRNVNHYLVLAGTKEPDLEMRCGYYGEKFVLEVQKMGLNTCWVVLTFQKATVRKLLADGDKLVAVIAVGYGVTQGRAHKSKPCERLVRCKGEVPAWFLRGAEAAGLAPTAMNQQNFQIRLENGEPTLRISGVGPYTRIDLGIVKCHFEMASKHPIKIVGAGAV